MVFFYRRFLTLDVCTYVFGAENDASSSNLPIPFIRLREAVSDFASETASFSECTCRKFYKQVCVIGLDLGINCRLVADGCAALFTPMNNDKSPLWIGKRLYGAKKTAATVRSVAGINVNVE